MQTKKLLLLAAVISVVGAAGYVGYQVTSALFSDTETSAQNTFQTGTLDMSVGGANGTAFDNIVVNNIGVDGTVNGSKTWTITNSGSVPGNLTLAVTDLKNYDNGCNEPEALVDTTCGNPGEGEGELGGETAAKITLNDGTGDKEVVSTTLATADMGEYATQWNTKAGTVTIPAGGSVTVKMDWANDPTQYGNEIQSDSLDYKVKFDLLQVVPQ